MGILDIKATLDDTISCDIEMQMENQKNLEERLLFYWSKMFAQGIESGKKYEELKKTIVILIADFELKNLQEIKKYVSKWNIREEESVKF